jgi:hypothetical protein
MLTIDKLMVISYSYIPNTKSINYFEDDYEDEDEDEDDEYMHAGIDNIIFLKLNEQIIITSIINNDVKDSYLFTDMDELNNFIDENYENHLEIDYLSDEGCNLFANTKIIKSYLASKDLPNYEED